MLEIGVIKHSFSSQTINGYHYSSCRSTIASVDPFDGVILNFYLLEKIRLSYFDHQ